MNLSTLSESILDFAFLATQRMRKISFAVLIAIGLYPHLAIGAGVKAGPFEIEFRSERSWGGGQSMNPFASYQHARYKLLHNGRAVAITPDSANGSKREWLAGDLLEAHFLSSRGQPVVLVCTETGTYLVHDEGGKPVVKRLHETPALRFQFLDSAAGQPGDLQSLNMGPDAEAMGRDIGKTGTLMLLPELDGVLDLDTRQFRPYKTLALHRWVANDPAFDGFSFDPSPAGQARVWWPELKQFALVRYTYRDKDTVKAFALELVDLKNDTAYLVPFDLNRTRLTALGDITPAWTSHYFQWNNNRLSLKKDPKPLPWAGSLKVAPTGSFHYNLQPVNPGMQPTFLKFLADNFGTSLDETTPHIPGDTMLTIQKQSFKLRYYESGKSVRLEPAFGTPQALTIKIAEQFNREISRGSYQDLFTSFGPGGFAE